MVVVWGLVTERQGGKRLAVVGVCGLAFNLAIYAGLFYFGFVKRGGVYDDLRRKLAISQLNSLIPIIELYKTEHGSYPDSLETLRKSLPRNLPFSIYDPTDMSFGKAHRQFYYELADPDHYYLIGTGSDGKPFTADDVHPSITVTAESRVGLVTKSPAGGS